MRQQGWRSFPGDANTVIGILELIRCKFCADKMKEWYDLCLYVFGDLFTCVREGPFPSFGKVRFEELTSTCTAKV